MSGADTAAATGNGPLSGKRISVDGRYLSRPGVGIHRYLVDLIGVLADADASVVVFADDRFDRGCVELPATVTVVRSPRRPTLIWEQYVIPRLLRAGRYDAHVAPANTGSPLWPVRTPVLLTVHDLSQLLGWREQLRTQPRHLAFYLFGQLTSLMTADRVLAVSQSSAEEVRRVSRRTATVVYQPTSFARQTRRPCPGTVAGSSPYVVCASGVSSRKLSDRLVRAMAEINASRKLHVVLVGANYGDLAQQVERLGVSHLVQFTGYVSEEEKHGIFQHARALVVPTLYEGFGLPVVEGFAAGVPVVSGTGGALAEIGGDAIVAIEPADPASIARGVLEATGPNHGELVRRSARRLAEIEALDGPGRHIEALRKAAR